MMGTVQVYLSHDLLRSNAMPAVNVGDVVTLNVPDYLIDGTFQVEEITAAGVLFRVPGA